MKLTLEQAMKAKKLQYQFSTSPFFNLGSSWAVDCQSHVPATLSLGKRPVTIDTGDWVGPKPLWTGAENLVQTGIRSRNLRASKEFLKDRAQ